MIEETEVLNKIMSDSMYNILLPIVIKILMSAVIPIILATIPIVILRKSTVPEVIKIIGVGIIKFTTIIIIVLLVQFTIKNIKLPEPTVIEVTENPFETQPEIPEVENPFQIPDTYR